MSSIYMRGIATDPVFLTADEDAEAVSGQVNGAVYQIDLYYADADGSTEAVITATHGTDTYDLLTATGSTEKPYFPRFTAQDPTDGSDLDAANTEVYLLAGETLTLTVTGNGTVTAVVKLLQ